MNRFLIIVIIVCSTSAVVLTGCKRRSINDAVAAEVSRRLGHPELRVGVAVSNWVSALGDPRVVPEEYGIKAFYYWPDSGVAVFAHPNYLGQFHHLAPEAWEVTSIYIPVRSNCSILIPTRGKQSALYFHKMLFSSDDLATNQLMTSDYIIKQQIGNELQAFEIKKADSIWGDYD